MKTILLPIEANDGQTARIAAATMLARAFGGHLVCVQTTPYAVYATGDNGLGAFPIAGLVEAVNEERKSQREGIEAQLQGQSISWEWQACDGDSVDHIARAARLADVVVMNAGPFARGAGLQLALAGDVAIAAPAPVIAVPETGASLDLDAPVLIAWDGSQEAALAMRAALPLLQRAASVDILTVAEKPAALSIKDAAAYLARLGVTATVLERSSEGSSIEAVIRSVLKERRSGLLVQGAYGHSRLRETIFGGVTRGLLGDAPVPLFIAH